MQSLASKGRGIVQVRVLCFVYFQQDINSQQNPDPPELMTQQSGEISKKLRVSSEVPKINP